MRNFWLLFLLLSSHTVSGQIDEVRRVTKQLCSPEFHGRGFVNHGDSLAANFLVDEFKRAGAEPVGDLYMQKFDLSVNTFPGEMTMTLGDRTLSPGVHFMVDPASNGQDIEKELSSILIDHEVVLDENRLSDSLGMVAERLVNCFVIDFTNAPDSILKELGGFGSSMASQLPVGFTVIEVINDKFIWSISQTRNPSVHIYVQDSIYEHGQKISYNIESKFIPSYTTQNVIARIPGTRKCSKKTIVFTAHYDHLGRMGSDTYFPGANDNASGTAMLITLAKHFSESPSKHDIIFIAFGAEEAGLVGSKYYVDNPLTKLKKIKFLINMDIMGSGEEGITAVNSTIFKKEYEILKSINEEMDLLAKVKKRGPTKNSDHYWFTEAGVPAFFIYTVGLNKNYHDIFDVYEDLTFNEYQDITTLLQEFVLRIE